MTDPGCPRCVTNNHGIYCMANRPWIFKVCHHGVYCTADRFRMSNVYNGNKCCTVGVPVLYSVSIQDLTVCISQCCRSAYEVAVNTVRLNLHYHTQYHYDNAALHMITVSTKVRSTVDPLISEGIGTNPPSVMQKIWICKNN